MEAQIDLAGLFSAPPLAPDEPAVIFQRSAKARNYRLTLRRDGVAVAVIPSRGSQREAERFVASHQDWLERARARHAAAGRAPPRCGCPGPPSSGAAR